MSDGSVPIIGMLGSAVAGLFGFMVWLYRSTLERAYKRIDVLEAREREMLALQKALEGVQGTLGSLVELIKDQVRERAEMARTLAAVQATVLSLAELVRDQAREDRPLRRGGSDD
jgi:hypothetical protein